MKVLALAIASTFVGSWEYFHRPSQVCSFFGVVFAVHDNYWMSFLFDLVSPPSGCGFQIQFYRTAIIQFTPPMKTITFVFPFRIPFFPSPACTCAGAHALRAPHVYNIIRCNQDRFLYYLSVYVKSFKELFLNLLVSGWFLKSECKSTNYFSNKQEIL